MIGTIFGPIFFIGRTVNSACTAYCVGQIAYTAFVKLREMQGEKMRANELRESFIKEFKNEIGMEPDEAIIRAALKSYNVVEHPVRQWIDDTVGAWAASVEKCVDKKWIEDINRLRDKVSDLGNKKSE